MRICILGLGYVGTVAGACFARGGHDITGIDIDDGKVDLFARGEPSFVEPGLDDLLGAAASAGRLHGTTDTTAALADAELVIITVGTPSGRLGRPNLAALDSVADEIGAALAKRPASTPCSIVLRSTVPPGTTRDRLIPRLEKASGRKHGDGWSCVFSPEFLREGAAIRDFTAPPQTIVGCLDEAHASAYLAALGDLEAPVELCSLQVAELMKYACNAFHALKIAFANEIGAVARSVEADGRDVMSLVCQDKVLNISPAYMRPGNAFGGSCLPKDLKGVCRLALENQVAVPLLASVLPANGAQTSRLIDAIRAQSTRRVGIVGIAFKDDTDDLRDSPMVTVVRSLLLDGLEVYVHDRHVSVSALRGRNLQFVRMGVPQLAEILVEDVIALASSVDTLVVGRRLHVDDELRSAIGKKTVFDLVGLPQLSDLPGYRSVFW